VIQVDIVIGLLLIIIGIEGWQTRLLSKQVEAQLVLIKLREKLVEQRESKVEKIATLSVIPPTRVELLKDGKHFAFVRKDSHDHAEAIASGLTVKHPDGRIENGTN
jgi:hypothetical protein